MLKNVTDYDSETCAARQLVKKAYFTPFLDLKKQKNLRQTTLPLSQDDPSQLLLTNRQSWAISVFFKYFKTHEYFKQIFHNKNYFLHFLSG